MKPTFFELYPGIVDAVINGIGCGIVEATEIVDDNEAYIVDLIEFFGETDVQYIAEIITTTDEGKY
jgi:hypothetical protein